MYDLGLRCLPMSYKKDVRLIRVNSFSRNKFTMVAVPLQHGHAINLFEGPLLGRRLWV